MARILRIGADVDPEAGADPGSIRRPLDTLLEDYQILEELPRGGQAMVYKAVHRPTKMKVALKVLLPALLGSAKARRAFEREVELAAGLSHPNIVRIHDSGISRGQYFFSMEYIHGRPLDAFASERALSDRDKVALFAKVCEAVACAHQAGVIHRDLKPSNVLVDERGEPHVVDFGLAKVAGLEAVPTMSLTGEIKGTVTYMSPEQAQGRSDLVDVRSDVYSLGVILYQLLTGRFPYDTSGSTIQVIQAIQGQDPTRPKHIIDRFDSDLEAILLKCLAKDRSQRYQAAAELHQELHRWLQGLPIVARSVSSWYLLTKVLSRHRYTSLVAVLLLVIVSGFSVTAFQLYLGSRRAQARTGTLSTALSDQSMRNYRMAQEIAFLGFLRAWQARRPAEASLALASLTGESRASKAARYLLDPNRPAAKEPGLRQALAAEPAWFMELVLAEDCLYHGDRAAAIEHYRQSRRLMSLSEGGPLGIESLLREYLGSKLYELTSSQ